ncbi:MAG: hypothetical protein U1A78_10125 [Polyangia bacterium]
MQPRTLSQRIAGVLEVGALAAVSLLGLYLWDRWLLGELVPGIELLRELRRIPERRLETSWQPFDGPARLRGPLRTPGERKTPRGAPSALWYAWVEDHYRSGRNTNTELRCSLSDDDDLYLQLPGAGLQSLSVLAPEAARAPGVPVVLFHRGEKIKLLKHGTLETLSRGRVAIDLGPISESEVVPQAVRARCGSKLWAPRGTLHYFEASVPLGGEVTLLACAGDGELVSCPGNLGALSSAPDGLAAIRRAYANEAMSLPRGAALLLLVALLLFCNSLLKRTERSDEAG